ncbi:Sir2 family NAD-dependent protein deacetylase [Amnibacterium sp. CER49]|uniref:Sir2 family NAD-dependent protein deacetylase n=1 Tax=Amnibacterium sp. CER49 TaxID=3039161 RepID=UPI002449904B|nr:Sir2 family NAD-dependent protein deacetylase [Amnibacterium sp. CER49]MDH2444448.1 Sir2 family NAD-dependent protein deacetylase [Amnibacterium sp. CER49]
MLAGADAGAATESAPGGILFEEALPLLSGRVAVLTGAGISTDSGIPDYRGKGSAPRDPMTIQQFLSGESFRQRYWAGSYLGWQRFTAAEPNAGHEALAALETSGRVTGVVTQNVDGLHGKAGSRHVVEVHGSVHRVNCLDCGQTFARSSIAARIEAANGWFVSGTPFRLNPDGDADVGDVSGFVVPDCTVCGGVLKPDVVFFGEFVPSERFTEAAAIVRRADALLVAGSSLAVNSGIRLLEQARRRRLPIVVVNRGGTKGDRVATVKLDTGTTEFLVALRHALQPAGTNA